MPTSASHATAMAPEEATPWDTTAFAKRTCPPTPADFYGMPARPMHLHWCVTKKNTDVGRLLCAAICSTPQPPKQWPQPLHGTKKKKQATCTALCLKRLGDVCSFVTYAVRVHIGIYKTEWVPAVRCPKSIVRDRRSTASHDGSAAR